MNQSKLFIRLAPWVFTIGLFVIWEVICRAFKIPEFFLPPPTAVFKATIDYWPAILRNSWITLESTMVGFFTGISMPSRRRGAFR